MSHHLPDVAAGPDAQPLPGDLGPRTPGEDSPDLAGEAPPPEMMNRDHPNQAAGRQSVPGAGLVTPDDMRTGVGRTVPDRAAGGPAAGPGTTEVPGRGSGPDDDVDATADDRGPGAGSTSGSAGAAARATSDLNFPADAARLGAPEQQRSEPAAGQNERAEGQR